MKGDVTADRHRTCGGNAMDALAVRAIFRADERGRGGRRSRVVLTPRRWCQARGMIASDRGKKARSPGRARRKPLKPSRRECRMMRLNLWCLPPAFLLLAGHG